MKENLFKSKEEMVLEELKSIKTELDSTKKENESKAYSRACRRYNTILIHLEDIPELDQDKKEEIKAYIKDRKSEMPEEHIAKAEKKYHERIELRQELGAMTRREKRIEDPNFFRSDLSKTKEQMVLDIVKQLEIESKSIDEDNFMLKSSMTISDATLSFEYLLDSLNNMPGLTKGQVEKIRERITNILSNIHINEEQKFEDTKTTFKKKSKWRRILETLRNTKTQPEKYINKYRQER